MAVAHLLLIAALLAIAKAQVVFTNGTFGFYGASNCNGGAILTVNSTQPRDKSPCVPLGHFVFLSTVHPSNRTYMFPSAVRTESASGSMQLIGGGVTHAGAAGADLLLAFFSDPNCATLAVSVVWETASRCWTNADASKELQWSMILQDKNVTSIGFAPSATFV